MLLLTLSACQKTKTLYELSPVSESGSYHAIVSIPAGTSDLYVYDPEAAAFKVKKVGDRDEYVPYLPFPANWGFIPSTYSDITKQDISSPIQLFILTKSYSKTTLFEIQPIASILFADRFGQEHVVPVATPTDSTFRTLDISSYEGLTQYPDAMASLESFYRNWKVDDSLQLLEWKDQDWTMEYINARTDSTRITYKGQAS